MDNGAQLNPYRKDADQAANNRLIAAQDFPLTGFNCSFHQNNGGPSSLDTTVLQQTRQSSLQFVDLDSIIGVRFARFLGLRGREQLSAIAQ